MIARNHEGLGVVPGISEVYGSECRYCGSKLIWKDIPDLWKNNIDELIAPHREIIQEKVEEYGNFYFEDLEITSEPEVCGVSCGMCPGCGWWLIDKQFIFATQCQMWHSNFGTSGALKILDLANIQNPIAEIRNYLVARYEDRFSINPLKFEQVVGSVFASVGYKTCVTAATNDGGIDVILSDDDGASIGVQVKRHKGRIKVEQIRSLLGAMALNGHACGIFVTTSTFQRGAYSCAEKAKHHGAQIELMDAERFLDLLKIAQIRDFEEKARADDWLPYSGMPDLRFAFQLPLNSI